jgi:hypothetical protein
VCWWSRGCAGGSDGGDASDGVKKKKAGDDGVKIKEEEGRGRA